jgi:hypothetical protein
MSWRDKFDQSAQEKIEEHWPKAQQIFQEKVGPAALSAAKNDDTMRSLFKVAYEAMPFPVRMVVKEEAFVQFCFSHRDKLLPSGEASGTSA